MRRLTKEMLAANFMQGQWGARTSNALLHGAVAELLNTGLFDDLPETQVWYGVIRGSGEMKQRIHADSGLDAYEKYKALQALGMIREQHARCDSLEIKCLVSNTKPRESGLKPVVHIDYGRALRERFELRMAAAIFDVLSSMKGIGSTANLPLSKHVSQRWLSTVHKSGVWRVMTGRNFPTGMRPSGEITSDGGRVYDIETVASAVNSGTSTTKYGHRKAVLLEVDGEKFWGVGTNKGAAVAAAREAASKKIVERMNKNKGGFL